MSSLTDFLLARIAEDVEDARRPLPTFWSYEPYRDRLGGRIAGVAEDWQGSAFRQVSAHIARWDPSRVLAECEAKRRIVQAESGKRRHLPGITHSEGPDMGGRFAVEWFDQAGIPHKGLFSEERFYERFTEDADDSRQTLRLLALPYADHPDYRQEWKP